MQYEVDCAGDPVAGKHSLKLAARLQALHNNSVRKSRAVSLFAFRWLGA